MKQINQRFIEREYRKVTGVKGDLSPADHRGVIMLACAAMGINARKIRKVISFPLREITDCLHRMRKSKIIKGRKLCVEWFEESGGIAFCADCAVIEGWLKRVSPKRMKS